MAQYSGYGTLPSVPEPDPYPLFPSRRLLVTVLSHLGKLCSAASQGAIGATLLTMVQNDTQTHLPPLAEYNGSFSSNTTEMGQALTWRYNWDKMTQGWVLSSYFLGYYVMQFFVGWLTNRYGGKRVALCGALSLAISQLVAIAAAHFGPIYFIFTMGIAGSLNGMILAPVIGVLARWAPRHESTRLSAIALSGTGPGMALVYSVSAVTSRVEIFGGWPFNFMALAMVLLLFCTAWGVWVTDSPSVNTDISEKERTYILYHLSSHSGHVKSGIPWRKILTSPPVYAVAFAQLGSDWMFFSLITVVPGYFKGVRHMETHEVDMLFGLPWLAIPFVSYLVSRSVDTLRKNGVSTCRLRKLSDVIAKPGSASLLLALSFLPAGTPVAWVVVLYIISVYLIGSLVQCSHNANVMEMSPEYAGVVYSLSQVFAMTGSFVAPLMFEALTTNDKPEEWQLCYGILFGIALFTSTIFVIFASSKPQQWTSKDTEEVSDACHLYP